MTQTVKQKPDSAAAKLAALKALLAQPGDLILNEQEKYGVYLMLEEYEKEQKTLGFMTVS